MTRHLIVLAAFLGLAVPAALAAPPADQAKPEKGKSAKTESAASPAQVNGPKNASKACKAERAAMGVEAFKRSYGTNTNKSNAHGKCVSGKSKAKKENDETEADEAAEEAAAKKCKAERATLGAEAFKNNYGKNKNKANAFGKCVSKLAKAQTTS
jgi:hypothetical protein